MSVPREELDRLCDLVDRGLSAQAYRRSERYGRLQDWTGTASRVVAGIIAYEAGAPRLSHAIHLRAWREAPTDPETRLCATWALLVRRGPWEAWKFQREDRLPDVCPAAIRVRVLTYRAQLSAILRDFDTAERLVDQAEDCDFDRPRVCVARSVALLLQDRYEEALDAAREAVDGRADYDPGVIATAQALTSLGRDEEALKVLLDRSRETESIRLLWILAVMQTELDDPRGALTSLDRLEGSSPLMEADPARRLAAARAEAHYNLDDREAAIRFAREAGDPFHQAIADRLERTDIDDGRVRLPVGFVRQHHKTCAPATLTAISRYWSREAEHLDIVEEICYDGTPAHSERNWAERNGWVAREFTVTWDSAVALLDRGIPFTLTTTAPVGAHLQAVIGYDARRGTFLIRDPSIRSVGEFLADALLEQARSTGPRGMVMVPSDSPGRLEGIDLPDAGLWDQGHAIQMALLGHDRSRAHEVYLEMSRVRPDHVVTQFARRALAAYDDDPLGMLTFADHMLRHFPDDPRWQLSKHAYLSGLGRENEGFELLRDVCRSGTPHPHLWLAHATDLVRDAREHREARKILRRLMAGGLLEAGCLHTLGHLEWSARSLDLALELYRFAACLDDKNEALAQGYFLACCHLERLEEAEDFLRRRARRHGTRSPGPLITLCEAYRHLGRPSRAVEVLEKAVKLHESDPDFLLDAARLFDGLGRLNRAEELLTRAETGAKRTGWLRASAELTARRGDFERALGFWREILEIEPLALDANDGVARLLATTRGPQAALDHLEAASSRFPNNIELQKLRIGRLIEWRREAAEKALRELIEVASVNTWARCQLAVLLGEAGSIPEAMAEVELATLLDPTDPAPRGLQGLLFMMNDRHEEAALAFRGALRLSVGTENAIHGLFAACRSDDEREEALDFLHKEILRQLSAGEAPWIYWHHAQNLHDPLLLLIPLRKMLDTRPGHRRCWSVVIRHYASLKEHDKATTYIDDFEERFPLDARTWIESAQLRGLIGDSRGEARALRRALSIDVTNGEAYRRLAALERKQGRAGEARRLLEEAVAAAPLDAMTHGWLAGMLWDLGEREEALSRLEVALNLDPGYAWAWDALRDWSRQISEPDRVLVVGRKLTARRAGEVLVWLALASALDNEQHLEERLRALDKALELDPRSIEAHDQRAEALALAGRYEQALEACRPELWSDDPPLPLKGRAAWIKALQGDLRGAIADLRRLVDKDRDYAWGWHLLAEWYRETGANEDYLQAATELVHATPGNASNLVLRGHAELLNEHREEALQAFRRAVELEPRNIVAGRLLFGLQVDNGDAEGANETFEELRGSVDPAGMLAMQIMLNAVSCEATTLPRQLGELYLMTNADEDDILEATNAAYARWPALTNRALGEALGRPEAHPVVGEIWIRSYARERHWLACEAKIDTLDPGAEITRRARLALLECMAQAQEKTRLSWYARRRRAQLHADTTVWSATLYAMTRMGMWRFMVSWAGDLEGREGLEPSALYNLALGLRALGRFDEAKQISERAWKLPDGNRNSDLGAWLAFDEALLGEPDAARGLMERFPQESHGRQARFLLALARAIVVARDETPAGAKDRFGRARLILMKARADCPGYKFESALRRAHGRCLRRITRERGGLRGLWWYMRAKPTG